MKKNNDIIHEVTPLSKKDCFYIVERTKSKFTFPLHTHTEFELNYIENGAGVRRIVGDSIEEIGNYDLVLVAGRSLEHVWEQHNCKSTSIREITIQFSPDLFSVQFGEKRQFESIREMLHNAQNGLVFPMSSILSVYSHLNTLVSDEEQGFYTVLKFLTILHELSLCKETRTLSSNSFAKAEVRPDSRRIQRVQTYIDDNYCKEIKVTDLANLLNMSVTAFSRFFKLRTGQSVVDYIIDVRIGNASRLLVNTTHTISEICFECGFNNLSNFNRIFKKKRGQSPKEFRNLYKRKRLLV